MKMKRSAKHFQQLFSHSCGAGGVLAGHQLSVRDNMHLPVSDFGVTPTQTLKLVFDQKRYDVAQTDRSLFGVGETCDFTVLDKRFAVSGNYMTQHTGCVADKTMWLVAAIKSFDQGNRMLVFSQVPQRTVAAWVEHRIEVISADISQTSGIGECLLRGCIVAETVGFGGLRIRFVAFWIERRLATGWRYQRDVCASVLEGEVGGGEFFQPEAGFLAGVAELIV